MINEIVLEDKKYDRSCRNVTIIEAEDSHLTDVRFVSKMLNLSDLYIRTAPETQDTMDNSPPSAGSNNAKTLRFSTAISAEYPVC
jgi:hypothetical protein